MGKRDLSYMAKIFFLNMNKNLIETKRIKIPSAMVQLKMNS